MDPWVPPLLNTLKFDYEAGSIVKVKTRNGKIFRGEVFQNPSRTGMPNSITLINIIDEGCSKPVSGFLTLFQHEILSGANQDHLISRFRTWQCELILHSCHCCSYWHPSGS